MEAQISQHTVWREASNSPHSAASSYISFVPRWMNEIGENNMQIIFLLNNAVAFIETEKHNILMHGSPPVALTVEQETNTMLCMV